MDKTAMQELAMDTKLGIVDIDMDAERLGDLFQWGFELHSQIEHEIKNTFWTLNASGGIAEQCRELNQISIEMAVLEGKIPTEDKYISNTMVVNADTCPICEQERFANFCEDCAKIDHPCPQCKTGNCRECDYIPF